MPLAHGYFEVTLTPQAAEAHLADTLLGRMHITKQFYGELSGTARGQMLTAQTSVGASAGYVAVEQVEATLAGRSGTFVLHHSGILDRGAQHLHIQVVPDSGTGELTGITGTLSIEITEDGTHNYTLDYVMPDSL
jgi:hypothetical protein